MENTLYSMYTPVEKKDVVLNRETPKCYAVYVSVTLKQDGKMVTRNVFMWVPKSQCVWDGDTLYVQTWVFKLNLKKGKQAKAVC